MKSIPINEARSELTRLPEYLQEHPEEEGVTVTRRGKPVLAVLSYDFFDAVIETLEVMADRNMMEALNKSIEEIQEGRTVKWEEAKKQLGL